MNLNQQMNLGFRTFSSAVSFIFSKGLWWAFIFPVVLNALLFIAGNELSDSLSSDFEEWIIGITGLKDADFFLSEFLSGFLGWLIWAVIKVLFFIVFVTFGGYLILILLSPLFAYLSERTEEIISGKRYPFNPNQMMRDVVRGVIIALRNLIIGTAWLVLLFIVGFIPVIGWVAPLVLFVISAYFYGFSFIDYTSERRKMKIGESIDFVRKYKGLAIANGTIFSLFIIIPFCGTMLSGFAAIVSVVAATLAVNEISPVKTGS